MSKLRWSITYQVLTKRSVEHGDWEEIGWLDADGISYALGDGYGHHSKVLKMAKDGVFNRQGDIRDVLRDAYDFDCLKVSDGDGWLQSVDQGPELPCTEYCLHVEGVTDSTKRRIHSLAENF